MLQPDQSSRQAGGLLVSNTYNLHQENGKVDPLVMKMPDVTTQLPYSIPSTSACTMRCGISLPGGQNLLPLSNAFDENCERLSRSNYYGCKSE
jgi:hypothetical protein